MEILKKKLSKEGLFSDVNKKKLPFYAKTVGIITASTGAAIQDIVNIASRRNSGVQLYLYPAIVQGADAAESIAKGIRYMDQMRLDVLIVGRGGGSFEDLFAFNEEVVIRAIYECETPVISAVGHETDTTLSDYVADMRAPTPSAAAELAVSLKSDIYEKLDQYKAVFTKSLEWKVNQYQNRYKLLEAKMLHKSPTEQVRQKRLYAIELEDKLTRIINRSLENLKGRLLLDTEKLKVLSPLHRLSGGYSYVQNEEGEALTSISQVAKEDKIRITLKDGKLDAKVNDLVRSDIR